MGRRSVPSWKVVRERVLRASSKVPLEFVQNRLQGQYVRDGTVQLFLKEIPSWNELVEVFVHEILHYLYPSWSEDEVNKAVEICLRPSEYRRQISTVLGDRLLQEIRDYS